MRASLPAVRRAAVTMAAVLGALASALLLDRVASGSAGLPVLAVVLTLTLRRSSRAHLRPMERLADAGELAAVGLAALLVGRLLLETPSVGDPLFVLALSLGIYLRRFGPGVRAAGRLIALPFLALLITPVPQVGRGSGVLWAPVVALLAYAWSSVADLLDPVTAGPAREPAVGKGTRLPASTKMAAQMAVGLGLAFAAGRLLFGEHWGWTVLSAYLVASGNRGRGDVVHKAGLRLLGAGAGTAGATLIAGHVGSGHRSTLVLIFVLMAVALVLRERSYAYWAAGVTAMVALLHGYYGESGVTLLDERLLGVLLGAVLGVLAAWFVLPVRTTDVFRRRVADCLAALTDDLAAPEEAGRAYPDALDQLDQLAPALRAHRLVARTEPHPVDVIGALHELAELPDEARERQRLRSAVVQVRRGMVGRADPAPAELPRPLATVHAVVRRPASPR